MVAPTKTISSLDPLGSLAQLGRAGMIRSLTTFYPDARREHRPAAPHACELPLEAGRELCRQLPYLEPARSLHSDVRGDHHIALPQLAPHNAHAFLLFRIFHPQKIFG